MARTDEILVVGETKAKRQRRIQTEGPCYDPPRYAQNKIGEFSHIGGGTNGEVNGEFLVDAETSNMR